MFLTSLLRIALTRSFKPFVFNDRHTENLDFSCLDNLGLYVHIPFCRSICGFCPYCKTVYDKELAGEYKNALLGEIDLVCHGQKEKKQITSLYFGGGTPALMIGDLKEIIGRLKKYFIIRDGIGAELHPDDINADTLETLKDAGVTMVSVGIQSFDRICLKALGRSNRDFDGRMEMVRSAGFDVVDVDLIFAIPGQTEDSLKKDIDTAFSLGATQVSTYPFIDFTFAGNKHKPLKEKDKKRLLSLISKHAGSSGKERTSVWTFAQKETGKYSSVTRDSFLGFGVSATTLLRSEFKINTFSIQSYIDRIKEKKLPTSLTLSFTKRQRACYYLFWNSYGMQIDPKAFEEMIGAPLARMYGFVLWLGRRAGLIKQEGGRYRLTEKGAYYYHYIEQAYTTAYIDKMWNISRIKAFPKKIILK
jgi:coproporphyrinogen III oxidase-like Fe-S oxidoreductase